MWRICPKEYVSSADRIMNDARRTSQSGDHIPRSKNARVCMHDTNVRLVSSLCFLLNTQQLPNNQNSNNVLLQPPCLFLKSCIVLYTYVNFNHFIDLRNTPVYFHLSLTFRQNRECCKIPSATSVRLGCVKKESSL